LNSRYIARVAVLDTSGNPIWYVHAALAEEMVAREMAAPELRKGRVRAIKFTQPAAFFARRVGPPSAPSLGVRFTYYERLDGCAGRIVQHHARALYEV
jgi:hypothetical protein